MTDKEFAEAIEIKPEGIQKTMIYIRGEWIGLEEYFNNLETRIRGLEISMMVLKAKSNE